MNDLNNSLPDLMRRATDNLEPESTDLVERGLRRGTTLRRRRTALVSFAGAGAVLATAGIIVGGSQLFADNSPAPATGITATPLPTAKTSAPAKPVTADQTLATLKKLMPSTVQISQPKAKDDNGSHTVSIVLNDGKGASLIEAGLSTGVPVTFCPGQGVNCRVAADGTVFVSRDNKPVFEFEPINPGGIRVSMAEIDRPDGTIITLYNYSAPKAEDVEHTRAAPVFSAAQLTQLALSDQWVFPPKHTGPATPDPDNPGTGKPTVPVAKTLQTFKQLLPPQWTLTQPETRGGTALDGLNRVSYLANDGKGLSRVEVMVQLDMPKTKCGKEGYQHCKVQADHSVLSWTTEEPQGGGITSNRVELVHPDGRWITLTSYNAIGEKDGGKTRAKPILSTEQMKSIAASSAWQFPGKGTK